MYKNRIFIILILLLNFFSNNVLCQSKKPSEKEIRFLAKKAVAYLNAGNFEKSIATSRHVLRYASTIKSNYLIAVSYNVFAANLDELSETDKAIFYYKKGLYYANKTDNDTIKNYINNNLGNIYFFEKKQYNKGIKFYQKSLEYSQKEKDTAQILFTKLNITWAYFDIGQFEKGLPHLNDLTKYQPKFGDSSSKGTLYMLYGMYYGHYGKNEKAESSFLNAIKLQRLNKDFSDLSNSHLEYSNLLFKIKEYKKAYEHLVLFNTIEDEIYSENKLKKANIAGINLELDDYKREVNKIEFEKKEQSESLKKSKIIVILFIIGFIILLTLFYSLYRNYSYKLKINKELIASNQQLIVAKEKAELATNAKTQFVSTMSHELRTPLYGVIGITDMLLDEHKELENSPYLYSLKFSAKYLLSLVNDILHINKIEEKKIDLENYVFNLSEEIHLIKTSLNFLAKNNGNIINVSIDPEMPTYILGDKLRLSQILINLLSNALKFTKNGIVEIKANVVKVETKSHFIEFVIKDNGVGIAAKDQEKIFENFVQVGRNENDYQGTGLGLSIVKQLLELFKSEIKLESELGVGTTFAFTIAFESNPERKIDHNDETTIDIEVGTEIKVLVVEDNKINQIITKRIIEKNNGHCTLVDDGFKAIEILEKEKFDIVLMDINMPMMNGFETTRKIRQKGILTPVIALTAFAKDQITQEAIDAGMNDIMIKPFEALELFKVINHQIFNSKNAGR